MKTNDFEQQRNALLSYIHQQRNQRRHEDFLLSRVEYYLRGIKLHSFVTDENILLHYIIESFIIDVNTSIMVTSADITKKTGILVDKIPYIIRSLNESGALSRQKHTGAATKKEGKREIYYTLSLPCLTDVLIESKHKKSEVDCPACKAPGLHFQSSCYCNRCNFRLHEEFS
jgi:hypothetical protein